MKIPTTQLIAYFLRYPNLRYLLTVLLRIPFIASLLLRVMRQETSGKELVLTSIGSVNDAISFARRAAQKIPAYQNIAPLNLKEFDWNNFPVTDKASYIHANHISNLLADNYLETFSIFRSSGSSGKATYWPQLKSDHRLASWAIQVYLESCFEVHQKKTLIVVGLSLGSWIGGDHISSLLKQCSLQVSYPLTIFAPGNRYEEILDILHKGQAFADQIVLVLCPSAIGHLKLLAESRGIPIPNEKLRYLVLGEAFPESFRIALATDAGMTAGQSPVFSMYGSADTGELGLESKASIALRQLLLKNTSLREELGVHGEVPHFFHSCSPQSYIETIQQEICVTRWQGVPIIRYNLHDQVTLYHWSLLRKKILTHKNINTFDSTLMEVIARSSPHLPPLIAVYGRADRCLILCGTNITEGMIGTAVQCEALQPLLTGIYLAKIMYDNSRQYLSLELELKQGSIATQETDSFIYNQLIKELGKVQPEFAEDWKQIYSEWDNDSQQRVLRVKYKPWPELSKAIESGIKHIGIQK